MPATEGAAGSARLALMACDVMLSPLRMLLSRDGGASWVEPTELQFGAHDVRVRARSGLRANSGREPVANLRGKRRRAGEGKA